MSDQPVLRVIRGDATPEELAAVVAVLAASGGPTAAPAAPAPSLWRAPQLRGSLHAGPSAWKASSFPS